MSKIPKRWEAYSKMGKVILGTTIMPIKVPLRESITSSLPPEERFSPSSLLLLLQKENLKLGGVVDLTYTTRYYDSQFFTESGIGYRKIFTAGRVIPDNKTYNQFASAIKELEKEGEVTCVHCTHGLNRSGYLICRYMIEFLNMEPQKAIKLFEDARGYKMERPNYIDDLMTRIPGDSGSDCHSHQRDQNNFPSHQNYQGNQREDYRWHGYRNDNPSHQNYQGNQRVDYGRNGYRNDNPSHQSYQRNQRVDYGRNGYRNDDSSHQSYQRNQRVDYGRNGYRNDDSSHQRNQRVDYGQRGYRNNQRSWNHHNGQRGRGNRSQHTVWNRDGLEWNHGAGFRQNTGDHRLGDGHGSGRNGGDPEPRWEAGPSCDNSYDGGYEHSGRGGGSRHRQGQSSRGNGQGKDYSNSDWRR